MAVINFQKYGISGELASLAQVGLNTMDKAADGAHDSNHVARMLAMLDEFLAANPQVASQIDLKVLVVAACWHDSWRASRAPKGIFSLVYNELWDGLGSVSLFKKEAKARNLDQTFTDKVSYVIRKHSSYQFLPQKTLEAQLFFDLDEIDKYSIIRIDQLKKEYLDTGILLPSQIVAAKFFFRWFMENQSGSEIHFPWTKQKFLEYKKNLLDEADKLMDSYPQILAEAKRKSQQNVTNNDAQFLIWAIIIVAVAYYLLEFVVGK